MLNSKQYLADKNILNRISFKDGQKHRVVLVKDQIDKIIDANGAEKEGVKYMVKENNEPKTFFTSSIGLIQKLAELSEGDEVEIQMKSKKGDKGFVSYFEANRVGEDTIPVIDEENYESEQGFFETEGR